MTAAKRGAVFPSTDVVTEGTALRPAATNVR
jgi:hypothetical protein